MQLYLVSLPAVEVRGRSTSVVAPFKAWCENLHFSSVQRVIYIFTGKLCAVFVAYVGSHSNQARGFGTLTH
jgi:hypothetical protein